MKTIKLIAISLAVLSVASCNFISVRGNGAHMIFSDGQEGSDELVTEQIEGTDFHAVDISIACEMEYAMSDTATPKVEISYPERLKDRIVVEIVDGVLCVRENDTHVRNARITVRAVSSKLESVDVKGALDLSVPGGLEVGNFYSKVAGACEMYINGLKADAVSFTISGAGDVDLSKLDSKSLDLTVSGAGDIRISGRSDKADVTVHGAGDIDLRALECENLTTSKNGAGRIRRR